MSSLLTPCCQDGRRETCSYTVTGGAGRWWRLQLAGEASVGWVEVTLSTPARGVTVLVGGGDTWRPCHPLQPRRGGGAGDRHALYTDCTGDRGCEVTVR